MKKEFYLRSILLLVLLLAGCLATNAHDFEANGIYYNKTGSNTVSVTYYGSNQWSAAYSGDIVIPGIVTNEGTSYTVTGISQLAFAYCSSLTSIILPNTLTSIGNSAFYSCDHLSEISFPSQLALIDSEAFCNCSTLTKIVIPRNLVSIGSNAFSHCAKVTSIEVENGNPKYDSRGNCNAIIETASNTLVRGCENTIIPNTITTIDGYAFDGCYGLTSMDIPNSVTSIGWRAFMFCTSLTSITIPNSITVIQDDLFYGCTSLATINIPNTIETIGSRAFYNTAWYNNQPDGMIYVNQIAYKYKGTAPNGTSLTINNGTKTILQDALIDCKGLSEVIIPGSVRKIGYRAFKGCTNLQNAVLGDSSGEQHMNIQSEAFSGCTALSSVTIGNSVSYLDNQVFTGCNNLKTVNIFDIESWLNVNFYVGYYDDPNPFPNLEHLYLNGSEIEHLVIPNTVNGIRSYAFYNCQRLKTIDIPNTVSSIGYGAFYLCDSITSIICRASNPPSFYDYSSGSKKQTFSSYTTTVQVPQDFLADYQSDSKWSNFSNIIGFNDRFSIDGINYLITSTNTVSVISHNLEYEYGKELIIPEHVDFEGVTYAVTAINDEAFKSCGYLKRVVIPNTVITIGSSAFENCAELREVIIGNSVISIGNSAFSNCYYLNRVTLGNSVVSIGDGAFSHGYLVPPDYDGEPLTSLIIPSSVESIGKGAFSSWWNLSSVNLRSVKTIGDGAFYGCPQLATVILGSNLASIGRGAFACRNEDIMNLVASFGSEVAESFSNLRLDIICMAPVPPTCVNNLVGDFLLDKTCLFVLRDALEDYMSAQVWSDIPQCYPIESEYNYDVDFIVDGICYLINADNDHEVNVVPFTTYYDGYYIYDVPFYSGDITIPEVVNYQGQDYTVTSIGGTFCGTGITSISLPCSITTIDIHAFSECTYLRSVQLPNTITEIGDHAFSECTNLTSINIPNSLEEIGYCVFENCESLSSIYIPASIYYIYSNAFHGCSSLSHIEVSSDNRTFDSRDNCNAIIKTSTNTLTLGCKNTIIPNSVTRIGDAAFSGCSGLTSINIPNSVTSIGNEAFYGCNNLTEINIPNSVVSVGAKAFTSTKWFSNQPDGLVYAGRAAYKYKGTMPSDTNIELRDDIVSITSEAFSYCKGLTDITFPATLSVIGSNAFYGCTGLTSIELPNSVTSIDRYAFYGCTGLNTVTCLALTPPTMNNTCFSSTTYSSAELWVPAASVSAYKAAYEWKRFTDVFGIFSVGDIIEVNGIYYQIHEENTLSVISRGEDNTPYCGDIVVPDSIDYCGTNFIVTSIAEAAFSDCDELSSIVLPLSITSIGNNAFDGCAALINVVIPDSVLTIGEQTFQGCTGLTSVTIGSSVTSMGAKAFNYCNALRTVTSKSDIPPVMANSNCFTNSGYKATLKVPQEALETYQTADYWYKFSKIESITKLGDANGDNNIDIDDVTAIINFVLNGSEYNPSCDMNGDQNIDIDDVTALIKRILNATD